MVLVSRAVERRFDTIFAPSAAPARVMAANGGVVEEEEHEEKR